MAVIDGKPVPLTNAAWIAFFACGCPFGALTAAYGDEVHATEDQAFREMYPLKRDRDRAKSQGRRMELMAWDRYRREVDLSARCPHTLAQRTGKAPLDAIDAEPAACPCGKPIPAGEDRVAYCSDECKRADDDHGPDSDETGGDES
jgi:hypothetical protein